MAKSLYITSGYSTITKGDSIMADITDNGKKALRLIFTDYLADYNSYNLKDKLGLSNAGSLKLLRSLHEKGFLMDRKMGNAIFYKANASNEYVLKLMELILMENESASPYVKGWMVELQAFSQLTDAILLFGSLLKKGKNAHDVDVCFILKDAKDYQKLQRKIDDLNKKGRLKVHPLYLTKNDLLEKLKQKDPPLIDMVRSCVVVSGGELFVEVVAHAQK